MAGLPTPPARVVETHISVLFFYRHRVFKFRRPVTYGFVDFSDPARRAADCERELELNRRLAPDVYLGTATLAMAGAPTEHAVVMRRLPDERNLAALVRAGNPVGEEVRRIAGALAAFHEGADRSPVISRSSTATALWQRWQATEEELGRFVGSIVDADRYRELTTLAGRFLRGRGPLLDRRIADGAVCDGHGDLHAADIFCLDDGPRLLDCLQFDDELRYADVLSDVAFLAADLDHLGAEDAGATLLEEYRRRSGRDQPPALVHFYIAYRAHIRLLVECLRAEQGCGEAGSDPAQELELALHHMRAAQPRLVLVGGLPGSGKTTLAASIGPALGAQVISSDRVRRETGSAFGEERYSDAARARVYGRLCDRAAAALAMGQSVVLDATWSSAARRAEAEAVARGAWAGLVELYCDCPADERRRRVADRLAAYAGESEATPAVGDALEAAQDPWPTAFVIDTSGTVEAARQSATVAVGSAMAG